jgi:hypothetical protein
LTVLYKKKNKEKSFFNYLASRKPTENTNQVWIMVVRNKLIWRTLDTNKVINEIAFWRSFKVPVESNWIAPARRKARKKREKSTKSHRTYRGPKFSESLTKIPLFIYESDRPCSPVGRTRLTAHSGFLRFTAVKKGILHVIKNRFYGRQNADLTDWLTLFASVII